MHLVDEADTLARALAKRLPIRMRWLADAPRAAYRSPQIQDLGAGLAQVRRHASAPAAVRGFPRAPSPGQSHPHGSGRARPRRESQERTSILTALIETRDPSSV